jgi:hypothetical protein
MHAMAPHSVRLYYARNLSHQPEGSKMYRSRYWDGPTTPLYPFGYGLSYTTFAFSNLDVAPQVKVGGTATVSVDVANTGGVAGDEVVQLYVHQRAGSDSRPMRELKGFRRVALKPGEKQTVTFPLGPDQLRYWSTSQRKWVQEAEAFDVWVGADSTATLHADMKVVPYPRQRVEESMRLESLRLAAALALAATLDAADVRTQSGLVSGVAATGVVAYKGIPYAAPPVGDLRWRAPRPAPPWNGVRAADAYSHDCMQEPFPSDAAPLGTPPAEDCLYLNVWAPEKPGSTKRPVMVWIHGGGLVNGGASPAV